MIGQLLLFLSTILAAMAVICTFLCLTSVVKWWRWRELSDLATQNSRLAVLYGLCAIGLFLWAGGLLT